MKYFFLLVFVACSLFSADQVKSLGRGQVVDGDYFARGSTVEISGTVNGDLYVLGGQVFIDGQVNGNVLAAGGTVYIDGNVSQNIRIVGGQVVIGGGVGGNVTLACASCKLTPGGNVNGNVAIAAGNVDLSGPVNGNVYVGTSSLRLADSVKGNVTAYVTQFFMTSKASIGGKLEYWSSKEIATAQVEGDVIYHPSFLSSLTEKHFLSKWKIGAALLPIVMNFLYTLVLGLILMRYFPHSVKRATDALRQSPLHSVLVGVVVLVLLPLVSLLFLMSILGVPFAITLMAVNVFAFYTAKIFVLLAVGKWLLKRRFEQRKRLYFTIGLIGYFTITAIPHFGDFLSFAVMLLGLGAMVRGRMIAFEKK